MNWSFLLLALTSILLLLIYLFSKYLKKNRFWKKQNVQMVNIWKLMKTTKATHLHIAIQEVYEKLRVEGKPCQAIEVLLMSALVVQDQKAIEDILISQYENFNERGFYVSHHDPLLTNLGRVEYGWWKPIRKIFASALTTNKSKDYFEAFQEVGKQMVDIIKDSIDQGNDTMEAYDLCQRYAIDIIGNVGFGLHCNCLRDPNAQARKRLMKAVRESIRPFYDQLARTFSKVLQFLDIKYHSRESIGFFSQILNYTMKLRDSGEMKRQDFMDNLLAAGEDPDLKMTRELMVGQVFGFFSAGFDNTSSSMSYVLYELAKNPLIQEKSRKEVEEVKAKYGNHLTYESLKEMIYSHQVVLETLRKYPVGHMLPRTCLRSSTVRTSTTAINIPANTLIIIPTYGIHHNPDYYPEPAEFRPERFEEKEIAKRPPCTFLSFGDGPKMCVAQQFTKANTVYQLALLLTHFRFSVCEKTPKALEFDRTRMFTLSPQSDIFLKVDAI